VANPKSLGCMLKKRYTQIQKLLGGSKSYKRDVVMYVMVVLSRCADGIPTGIKETDECLDPAT
jgi:hypothetical protein